MKRQRFKVSLTPDESMELLGRTNKNGLYRFSNKNERDEIAKKRDNKRNNTAFNIHCKERGIDNNDVSLYWDKTKEFSVLVRPDVGKFNVDHFIESIKEHKPNYSKFKELKKESENLLVLDIADVHFGKYASITDTGESYNLTIAKQRCLDGIEGIINKARGFGVDKVLFVLGNDVLHIDNLSNTTTGGTRQDVDGKLFDVFDFALSVYVEVLEKLSSEFTVDVIFNESNHDNVSGWMFARTLESWFRTNKNIIFDCAYRYRKYYKYGNNMIGLNHGDGAKVIDLPLLMANEEAKMWASTTHRYIYLHHYHHKIVSKFQSGKDYIGVTIEYLRSPSGTDSWHAKNGYVGVKKAIEGFIHNKSEGQIARITHYF